MQFAQKKTKILNMGDPLKMPTLISALNTRTQQRYVKKKQVEPNPLRRIVAQAKKGDPNPFPFFIQQTQRGRKERKKGRKRKKREREREERSRRGPLDLGSLHFPSLLFTELISYNELGLKSREMVNLFLNLIPFKFFRFDILCYLC